MMKSEAMKNGYGIIKMIMLINNKKNCEAYNHDNEPLMSYY